MLLHSSLRNASTELASCALSQQHQSQSQNLKEMSGDNIQLILNVQVPFSEYATADVQVETTERLSEAEIVWRAQGHHHPEGEEQDGEDADSDDNVSTTGSVAGSTTAADESEIIHTSNQFLHTVAQQKDMFLEISCPLVLFLH